MTSILRLINNFRKNNKVLIGSGFLLIFTNLVFTSLNPALIAYCMFLGGILAVIHHRYGINAAIVTSFLYLLIHFMLMQEIVPFLQINSNFLRFFFYTSGMWLIFYGVANSYYSPWVVLKILLSFLLAILVSAGAIKLFLLTRSQGLGMGEGLAIFVIGVITFFLVFVIGLIFSLTRK